MKLSMTTEIKNLQHKSYVKRRAEATYERKFKRRTVGDEFHKFSNEIEDVYQMKLKTDSHNGFVSSRCIFFM
jgi:hypothetical protein